MQILGNIFYAVIFVTVIGSIFTVLSLFVNHVLRCTLPLWFAICGMIFFCVPFLSPAVVLVSPEIQDWIKGFRMGSFLWIGGCGLLLVSNTARLILAKQAVKQGQICSSQRLNRIFSECVRAARVKKAPRLYCKALHDPICVAGVWNPVIMMNESMMEVLTDKEAAAVFSHELTHVKRRHMLLQRIYDYVCIVNWMNPFSWIARGDFSLHCETDCDSQTLKMLRGKVTETEYASAMIRLLEYGALGAARAGNGLGALDFLFTKRRIQRITAGTSKIRDGIKAAILAVLLALTLVLSMRFSRGYFYPYPAYDTGTEYCAGYKK